MDALFDFYIPWDDDSKTPIDLSGLLDKPAGKNGYIKPDKNGHLTAAGKRIRFWGVNFTFANNFPDKASAEKAAGHLAKYGVNIVRFHHMDMFAQPDGIWTTNKPDRKLSPGQLDKLDYFVSELKTNGIYVDINLLVSRPFNLDQELNPDINKVKDWKVRATLGFFDPAIMDLQKKYAKDLLDRVNPYTNTKYTEEPSVAVIEINNENGLVQAYKSRQLNDLPPFYKNSLFTRWNAWLKKKYGTHEKLVSQWGVTHSASKEEILGNGNFKEATLESWRFEQHEAAKGKAETVNEGPAGDKCLKITVITKGTESWHVQFNQPGISFESGVPYTLSFMARSDTERTMSAGVMMAHEPWQNLGFDTSCKLAKEWKEFEFTFSCNEADTNGRVNFSQLADKTGSLWIARVSLIKGGSLGLFEGENLDGDGINIFTTDTDFSRTENAKVNWYEFLLEVERNYWTEMYYFLKNTLKVKQPVMGTIVGCSTPNLMAGLDMIDTHSYFRHPAFPGIPWDQKNWYVKNDAMVNVPGESTLAGLFTKQVEGKPHSVSEYNQAHPNSYQAEAFFFLSVYAAFQDWDMLIPFDYSHGYIEGNMRKAQNFFDVDQNPVKLASYIPCSLAFLREDIQPARQTVGVPFPESSEARALVKAWAWQLVDGSTAGADPLIGLVHKLSLVTDDKLNKPSFLPAQTMPDSKRKFVSDTEEIVWDVSVPRKGILTCDTAKTKIALGYLKDKRVSLHNFTVSSVDSMQNGFCVISASLLKGNSFQDAEQILITALGSFTNTDVRYYEYPDKQVDFPPPYGINVTTKNKWGRAPTRVEGIQADILFSVTGNVTAWALDNTGNKKSEVPVKEKDGKKVIAIDAKYGTVWYLIERIE
ncbi:MAG: carbohydrate binding domain-containing protein [Spirochaetales bacterium]|nr:carbohydrate binding domain-containing protein [Spirochaetales bacterium]